MILLQRFRICRSLWILAFMVVALIAVNCSDSEDAVGLPTGVTVVASEQQTVTTAANGSIDIRIQTTDIAIRGLGVQTTGAGITVDIGISRLSERPENAESSAASLVYQYLEVTHPQLATFDVMSVIIEFGVDTKWLDENGVPDAERITLERFSDGWETIPTDFIGVVSGEALYRATSPGLSLFAIAVIEDARPSPTPTPTAVPVSEPVAPVATPSPAVTATPRIVEPQAPTPTSQPTVSPTAPIVQRPTVTPTHTPTPSRTPTPVPTSTVAPPTAVPTHTVAHCDAAANQHAYPDAYPPTDSDALARADRDSHANAVADTHVCERTNRNTQPYTDAPFQYRRNIHTRAIDASDSYANAHRVTRAAYSDTYDCAAYPNANPRPEIRCGGPYKKHLGYRVFHE